MVDGPQTTVDSSREGTTDGRTITYTLFKEILPSELEAIKAYVGEEAFAAPTMKRAIEIFDKLVQPGDYVDFLTLPAYGEID